ncbi:RDD family protein [Leptospira wolffii]|uniref:RDD family protein n=1 Tax=Leptospira wolffii TaxID=409998 RepID=UPI00030D3669|nr:RDD family protein [Leptospira wolffii]EPG64477.1 RDD family protein [Leptospira wolffii serovar Khorat str. Khorat-H2]
MRYAHPIKRIIAQFLDFFLGFLYAMWVPVFFAGLVIDSPRFRENESVRELVLIGSASVYPLLNLFLVSSRFRGSIGKILMRIQITDLEGNRIGFLKAFARTVFKAVSASLFLIPWMVAFFDSRKQTVHDKIVDTLVLEK